MVKRLWEYPAGKKPLEIDWEHLKDIKDEHDEGCLVCNTTNEICALAYYFEAVEQLIKLAKDVPAAEDAYIIPAWKEWFQRRKVLLGE